jgi:hypothetical protein
VQFFWCFSALLVCGCNNAREEKAPKAVPKVDEPKGKTNPIDQVRQTVPIEATPVAAQSPWGSVKGQVVWGGDPPAREEVKVPPGNQDRMFCLKDGPLFSERWVVDAKTKGLRYSFVWLAPQDKGGKLAVHPERSKLAPGEEKVVMDQPVCMFVPNALALREGQILVVKNSAKVLHSFKWSGHPDINAGGNPSIPPGEHTELRIKAERNLITIECGFHPWMRAAIMAFDHPYFAVTDEQGRFEIKDAPAGPCRLMVRHSDGIFPGGAKGRDGRTITIQPGVNDVGAIDYPPPKD